MEAVAQRHTNKWRNQNLNLGSTATVHVDSEPGRKHLLTTLTQSSNLSPRLLPPCVCSFFENAVLHLLLIFSMSYLHHMFQRPLHTFLHLPHCSRQSWLGCPLLGLWDLYPALSSCAACPVFSCDLVCFYYGMVSLIQSVLIVFPNPTQ